VRLLLDSHTFLWHADGDPRMSPTATALLIDPANELFLSISSIWEIAIKVGLKKLILSSPYASFMTRAIRGYGLIVVPIGFERSLLHARQVRGRLIGQTVVDDDKLPRLPRVSPESGDAPHRRVTSSGSQRGMLIDARPASDLLGFTALRHHGSGESGEAIVRSS
jgi:PIN domain nuclease of toxin-antitoxin system